MAVVSTVLVLQLTGYRLTESQTATLISTPISRSVLYLRRDLFFIFNQKQDILGQLSAEMRTTASTAKMQEYFYRHYILGSLFANPYFWK